MITHSISDTVPDALHMLSLNLRTTAQGRDYCPILEMRNFAWRGYMTFPRSHSLQTSELELSTTSKSLNSASSYYTTQSLDVAGIELFKLW